MKLKFSKILLLGVVIFVSAIIASYFLFFHKNTNDIHIALVTSDREEVLKASQRSIRMCVDAINENGGVNGNKIVLDVFNDRGNPDIAREIALEIVQQNRAIAVIGHHYSDCSVSAGEIYKKYGIPAITPWATNVKVTKDNPWYFRTVFNDKLQGQFLASYARKVLKQESVSIIHDNRGYGSYLAGVFEKVSKSLGAEIKYKWTFRADDEDLDRTLRSIVYELRSKNDAGTVFIATYPKEGVRLVRLIKDTLVQNPLMLPDSLASISFSHGFSAYPKEKRNPGYYTNGIYVTTPFLFDTGNNEAQSFREKYQRTYQEEPGWHSAYAYDTIRLLGEIMTRANISGGADIILEERKTLRDHLAKLTQAEDAVKGLTGLNYFDASGDSPKPISIGVYTNRSIISALTQLQPVENVYDIPDLKQARADDRILIFGGRYMYKTKVIYTGVKLNELSEIDVKKMTCLLDFHIWFRYEGNANVQDIEFLNAVDPTPLGEPVDVRVKDQFTSKLYHVRGYFKTDFLVSRDALGGHLAGFSFRHRDLTQDNLLYVKDILGMGLITEKALSDEMRQSGVLPSQSGWTIVRPFFSHDVSRKNALGNLDYLRYQRKAKEYSQFSFGVRIRKSVFTIRGKLSQEWAFYLLLVSVGMQLALTCVLYMSHTLTRPFSKAIWLLRTIFAILMLLSAETLVLNLLLQKTDISVAYLRFVELTFDILWWIIPAFLVNLLLKSFVWEAMEARSGQPVPNVLRRFLAYIIFFVAFYGIVAFVFDQSLTKLMATSGVVAMAIGFVVKANISNFFSGIVIHQGSAIRTGDWVKIGAYEEGRVVDITWRSTKLKARDGSLLSVPNSTVSDSIVHNYNFPDDLYEVSLSLDVDAVHPPAQIRKILLDAVISADGVLKSPEPTIRFKEFTKSAASYSVEFFIRDYGRKSAYKEAVWERIWMHLNFSGIFRENRDTGDQAAQLRNKEVSPLTLLAEMDIFQPFSHDAKIQLSREMRRHHFPPGEVIVEQGETHNSLFVIAEGVVGVWIKMEENTAPFEIVRMGAGNFFGEMALLTGEPRVATIISVTDTYLFEVTKEDIFPLIEEQPEIFKALSKVLTERKIMTESQKDLSLERKKHIDRNALSISLLERIQTFFGKNKK